MPRVDSELEPGERITWAAQPIPGRFARRGIGLVLFGIPWTAFAIFWIAGASGFKIPDFSHGFGFFPLFGVPFVLIGFGMLSSPYWMRRKACRTSLTLQIQVNAGAELKDALGNALNTSSAIADDTTLAVLDLNAYWDINGAPLGAGGATPTGTWDATSTYWNVALDGTDTTNAWGAGQTAVFAAGTDATGTYTVTVSGTKDIGGLAFEEGMVTLTGGTALRLAKDVTVDVGTGLTATVGTPITQDASSRALTKSGEGTLVLSKTNTYAGGTTITGGTLRLGDGTTLGSVAGVISNNAALIVENNAAQTIGNVISGTGALTKQGSGALTLSGPNEYYRHHHRKREHAFAEQRGGQGGFLHDASPRPSFFRRQMHID